MANRSSGLSRYYSPETGQYLLPDPLGLAGGVNPYSYVPNPVSWIDPLGLAGCLGTKSLGNGPYKEIEKIPLPPTLAKTFSNSEYKTVVTTQDMVWCFIEFSEKKLR
ncbi:hypothetical protein C5467_23640 [Photorhabdus khanii subsp. guanajuatensis]|uniref:RHS repeat-associated core domain-containing protein n=1 Tax=Photorhabdus khanii subsp. guanajuatensis TaxID=2100166 RepID=A0A4R4IR68_9GAMM|nr:RHS repeat-associated core domain-containing protein [Photorhabdus khanii]TDB42669.1 hypothetical protein C5467_23640 [Photorhabdus khanii subsp. guanajuatensis]